MKRSVPFARSAAIIAAIPAAIAVDNTSLLGIRTEYQSRGKGKGKGRSQRAKSSFKQNKRRGL